MDAPSDFDWDDAKAASNEAKHAVPFPFAARAFLDDDREQWDVSRAADGENRQRVVAVVDGRLIAVTYTMRGTTCRLISARPASKKEVKRYGDREVQA